MKKAYKFIAPALIGILGFSSCSNEENGGFQFPTAESVIGNYQGTIQTPSTDSTQLNKTAASVGLDSIYIADMAVDDIIRILAGDSITDSISYPEQVAYTMKYERKINLTFDTVWVATQPDTLRFDYTRGDSTYQIKVVFDEEKTGAYSIFDRELKLNLQANKLIINEDTVQTFHSIPYQILLNKQ